MLHIDAETIDRTLTFPELVNDLRSAFAANWVTPTRHHHIVEHDPKDSTLLLMPSWTGDGEHNYIGVKIVTVHPDNGSRNLPAIHGVYYLTNGNTGESLATLDGTRITVWRTAAASALASTYLSRPDSSVLTMIGSGALSPFMIRAHMAVRPIEQVYLWNHNIRNAHALAEKLSAEGLPVTAHPDLVTSIGKSDIVSSATLSTTPLIFGKWLKPGTHVDTVGAYNPQMRETDDELVRTATIFCDTWGGALHEGGDLAIPLSEGVITRDAVKADLHDLARGTHPGRTSDSEITYFKSVGTAVEDLAAAVAVYERASR